MDGTIIYNYKASIAIPSLNISDPNERLINIQWNILGDIKILDIHKMKKITTSSNSDSTSLLLHEYKLVADYIIMQPMVCSYVLFAILKHVILIKY